MNIMDLASTIAPDAELKEVGIRPGEKLHEQMIGIEDSPSTYEFDDYYKILPMINDWNFDQKRIQDGIKVDAKFTYDSSNNTEWMTKSDLQTWIKENESKLGKI